MSAVAISAIAESAPCIRCGECISACPAELSPLRLFALWRDSQIARMAAEESLDDCILCRRCDEVCPSELPLADAFAEARRKSGGIQRRQKEAARLRARHDSHLQRMSAANRFAKPSQLNPAELAKQARARAAAKLGRRS